MTKYNIPLRVKLSNREHDKIKNKINMSKFVREAINSYYGETEKEIELSKKKILIKLKEEIKTEQEKFKEKMIKEQDMQEEKIISKINEMYDECESKLETIEKENREYERLKLKDLHEKSSEEKILEILPTLQGIYHSENGLNYDKIKLQALSIDVTPLELEQWIENNHKLLENDDYKFRDVIHSDHNNWGKVYDKFDSSF